MNDLHVLTLRDSYHKGVNDIASDFYLPCMSAAKSYDRAVGFFSSTIYILAWPALRDFVQRGGRIRLLCSPFLAAQDTAAIELGYTAKTEESVGQLLREEISGMLKDSNLQKPTRLLAALVAIGVVEIKIVFLEPHADGRAKGIFHDKVGIFSDEGGNVVVFKGSMNETWLGLAADGNIESIDVFASWAGPDALRRVDTHVEYFRSLWENSYPMVTVRRFPEIARAELMKAADIEHWTDLADEILREMASASAIQGEIRLSGPEPRAHQLAALDGWFRQNRRGILEHATGSGKTLTAILAMRDSMKRSEVPIVLVPTQVLLDQWVSDITDAFGMAGVQLLCCGAGHAQWKDQDLLRIWSKPSPNHRVIIATVQTASSDEFLGSLTQGSHLFLIADEVHRLGSPKNQRILTVQSGPRLGLSATPRRAGDPVGTQAVFDYFGGIVEPPFTLRDAIRAKLLTPYMYHPRTVLLTLDEQIEWNRLAKSIALLFSKTLSSSSNPADNGERIKQLLIRRASIVKQSSEKVQLALQIVKENFVSSQRWLIYCDDLDQLGSVMSILQSNGFPVIEFHSGMQGDRVETLRYFEANGGIMVSIRCLDEGVDIPNASHALILASSKNPREFIQRRGRVLRLAPYKSFAVIYDAIVIPRSPEPEAPSVRILEGELSRAIQFAKDAENPSASTDLERIAVRLGIEYLELLGEGFEDDT